MAASQHRRDHSRPDGFTLVELLIVIVILGILATVTVFAVRGITDKGQSNSEAADLRMLQTANEAYWLKFGTNATEQDLVDGGFLKRQSALFDLTVDADGALTITNVRTGSVAGTAAAGSGGGSGGGGGGSAVGSVTGIVKNATNEAPIAGVAVCVRTGSLCTTTNASGSYSIADVPVGPQTIDFTVAGFSSLAETVTIAAGTTTTQSTAMSPQLAAGDLRIVLTWGASPSDLDSYLWVPSGTEVSYRATGSLSSAPFAQLDADDTTGFGPETITISQLASGTYTFSVNALGGNFVPAETTVRVYGSSGLLQEFAAPAGSGNWWRVFTLNGATGAITTVNTNGTSGSPN
jgi:prepilin-type N-terminal cleavage/methylation domain-containing protein